MVIPTKTMIMMTNPFKTITNAIHKVHDGLASSTIGTGMGEILSETGLDEIGKSFLDCGSRSIDEATETTRQVPLIGESLSSGTYNTLSNIRTFSSLIGKGFASICKANRSSSFH